MVDVVDEFLKEKNEAMSSLDDIEDEYYRNEYYMKSECELSEVEVIIVSARSESDFTQRLHENIKECEKMIMCNNVKGYSHKKRGIVSI